MLNKKDIDKKQRRIERMLDTTIMGTNTAILLRDIYNWMENIKKDLDD